VTDGVVFDDELRGDGSAEAEGEGCRGVELLVGEGANGGGGFAAVAPEQFESGGFGDLCVFDGMIAVELGYRW